MTRRSSSLERVVALVLTGTIALGGCARLPIRFGSSTFRGPRASGVNVGQGASGNLSPTAAALVTAASPLAREGIRALTAAWSRRAAQRREADARAEEARRKQIAEAQVFYARECTTLRPAAPAKPALTGAAGDKEKEAEAAFRAGDPARASALLQAVYEEKKKEAGESHPEAARLLNKLAVAESAAGNPANAFALASRGYEVRKGLLGEAEKRKEFQRILNASLDVAESETTLGLILRSAGEYESSRRDLEHALEVRTKYLKEDHLCVAQSQTSLGELEQAMGAYGRAKALYYRALATREKWRLPDDDPDRAQSYNDLGSLHRDIALYDLAKSYYEEALASRLKLGADRPEVADSYQQLGALHRAKGDFAQAEAFYEKALAIRQLRFDGGIPVADTETSLAQLHSSYGDYERAEGLLVHALGIREQRLKPDHPDLAESLSELGRVQQAKREYAPAEKNDRAALAIWEKGLGPEHLAVARGSVALGELLLAEGKLDDAQASFARSRAIREKALGPDHPDTAESIERLGEVAYARRDYGRAEPLFRAAIDIRKKRLGEQHPTVAAPLAYLAALLVATDRPDAALQAFRQAQLVAEEFLDSAGAVASESRLDAMLRMTRAEEEAVYSLLLDGGLAPRAAPLALSVALLRKGRSVDEAAGISRAAHLGLKGEQREKFSQLRALRAQIASQKLSPTGAANAQEAKQLEEQAELLDAELARTSAASRTRRDAPKPDDVVKRVAAALPERAVLVEVVKHRAYRFKARQGQRRWDDPRYSAMVLDRRGGVQVADLGPASIVDAKVKAFLDAITGPAPSRAAEGDASVKRAGQELAALVVQPIRPLLAGSTRVVLSPDGQLNVVPFGALFDGRQYLIDSYELTYVTSGRDLLPRAGVKRSRGVALLARPTFMKGPSKVAYDDKAARRGFELVADPGGPGSLAQLSPGAVPLKRPPDPLLGTEQEAKAIHALIPSAKVVMGSRATKEYFLGLQAPGILHVATHGLFRPDASEQKANARGLEVTSGLLEPESTTTRRSEPLLNSMLLWANVGAPWNGGGAAVVLDPAGLATALEVAGMNLWGTQLVVLSACETGRGQVDDLGQGVYGLRRAVMVAGAETLVTSLWQVDDKVTRDLMTAYYRRLLAGEGRAEALRQASLSIREKHPEPAYWAPFLAIGQVGPVKGIQ